MSEKIARLGIERDNDLMYYIKSGEVWATPRKKPGQPKGKAKKIAPIGVDLDYSKYLYFVDGDGDVARNARKSGGGGRSKAPKAAKVPKVSKSVGRSAITGHFLNDVEVKRHPKTSVVEKVATSSKSGKTFEQLEREIDECLARSPSPTTASAKKKRR